MTEMGDRTVGGIVSCSGCGAGVRVDELCTTCLLKAQKNANEAMSELVIPEDLKRQTKGHGCAFGCECDLIGGDPDCTIQPPYESVSAYIRRLIERISRAEQRVKELEDRLRWRDESVTTHWPECGEDSHPKHHACSLRLNAALKAENERLKAPVDFEWVKSQQPEWGQRESGMPCVG